MDWEHNRQELFDTGVTVFNLDHDVVENIKKLNINFQEKVNNNIIGATVINAMLATRYIIIDLMLVILFYFVI